MPTVTIEDTDRYLDDPHHNKLLFITGSIDDQPMSRIMIDSGSAVNILPVKIMSHLGIDPSWLRPSSLVIQGFKQNEQHSLDSINSKTKFGHIED